LETIGGGGGWDQLRLAALLDEATCQRQMAARLVGEAEPEPEAEVEGVGCAEKKQRRSRLLSVCEERGERARKNPANSSEERDYLSGSVTHLLTH